MNVTMETPSDPEGLVTGNLLSHYMAPYVIFGRTVVFRLRTSGYGYGTVPGGRWAIDTEGGHVVVSVSLIRNGYEYGKLSRGKFRIPVARASQ